MSTLVSKHASRAGTEETYLPWQASQSGGTSWRASKGSSAREFKSPYTRQSTASTYMGSRLPRVPEERTMSRVFRSFHDITRRDSGPPGAGSSEDAYHTRWFGGSSNRLSYGQGLPLGSYGSTSPDPYATSREFVACDEPIESGAGSNVHATEQWRPVSYPPAVAVTRLSGNSLPPHQSRQA